MGKQFKTKNLDIGFLSEFSGDWAFTVFEVLADSSNAITVFSCQTQKAEILERDWLEVTDYINSDYLAEVESEFERWNSYLLFTCTEKAPKSLQYEIENNKFSMRKIVEHYLDPVLGTPVLIKLLNRKILSAGINYHELVENTVSRPPISAPKLSDHSLSLSKRNIASGLDTEAKEARSTWIDIELARNESDEN